MQALAAGNAGWLRPGNAGWLRFDADKLVAYLRLAPDSRGHWTVRELVLDASEGDPITAGTLSALPLARIEIFANTDVPTRDYLREHFDLASPVGGPVTGSNIAVLASHFAATYGSRTDPGRNWAAAAQAATVHGAQRVAKRRPPEGEAPDVSYRLAAPTGGLTDEFLRSVGRAYAAAIARGESPNVTLAADAQVPRRSVERWVYLARKSRAMPAAARKGSRG
jgi:hypothetical protein